MQDVAPELRTAPAPLLALDKSALSPAGQQRSALAKDASTPRKRGPKPRPIVEFPEPLWTEWEEAETLSEALILHMRRHGDSVRHLFLALDSSGDAQDQRKLMKWCTGQLVPRTVQSLAVLKKVEHRYRLPVGYFRSKAAELTKALWGLEPTGPRCGSAALRRRA